MRCYFRKDFILYFGVSHPMSVLRSTRININDILLLHVDRYFLSTATSPIMMPFTIYYLLIYVHDKSLILVVGNILYTTTSTCTDIQTNISYWSDTCFYILGVFDNIEKVYDGILGDQSFGVLVGLHLELILMIIIVNFVIKYCCCCLMFLFYFSFYLLWDKNIKIWSWTDVINYYKVSVVQIWKYC